MLGQNKRTMLFFLLIGLVAVAQLAMIYPKITLAADSRLAGSDRYRTAVEISQAGWFESDYVILVRGDDYADALCAGPLAKKYKAPILFTERYRLNPYTLKEIERLKADKVIIIGGYGAISKSVDNTLDSEGIDEVERIYGSDRYETSVKIAQRIGSKEAALATGMEYADALSISAIAATKGFAIVLTNPNYLPDIVKLHLNNYKIENTYLIGGDQAIHPSIDGQVRFPLRFAGQNRYETNCLILEYFVEDLDFNKIYAAPGEGKDNYVYALAGAALAAQTSSPIVLNSTNLPVETRDYIQGKMTVATEIVALGGEDVVPEKILNQYRQNSNQVLKSVFNQKGVYGPSTGTATIAGNLAIEEEDIIVVNTIIEGDLLLGEGIGDGTVELRNVTVKGRATIRGGWDNEIIGDGFVAASVIIDIEDEDEVELVLTGKSKVGNVEIHSNAFLDDSESTSGGFTNVNIIGGEDVLLRGEFSTVSFAFNGVGLRLGTAKVNTLNARSSGDVWGTGTINTANIGSDGVNLYIIPSVTNVAKGYRAYVGGEWVSEGKYTANDIVLLQNDPISNLKVATVGNSQVSFTFSKPTNATGVVLKQSTDGGSTWTNASTGSLSKSSSSATATGLTNGQRYYFKLVVSGGIRAGDSNKVSATPEDNFLTDLAGIPGNGKADLAFSAPTGASSVTLKQSEDGGLNWTTSSTSSPLNSGSTSTEVLGLTNGTTYRFKLVVVGGSRAGDSNIITLTPVQPINNLTGTPGFEEVNFTFSAPTGATNVTLKQSTDDGTTWENSTTTSVLNKDSVSAAVTGLISSQEYKFKLVVIGGARAGESNTVTVTPN